MVKLLKKRNQKMKKKKKRKHSIFTTTENFPERKIVLRLYQKMKRVFKERNYIY